MRPAGETRAEGGAQPLPPRDEIAASFLADEVRLVTSLAERARATADERKRIAELAGRLVKAARANRHEHGGVDAFMHEYALTSEEGIILMCLAEALLRIPDADTADALIAEKIGEGRWEKHLGASDSLFVNASTFGLMLTGRVVRLGEEKGSGPAAILKRLIARSGEPLIRQALRQAMRILGDNFVLGRSIEDALSRAADYEARGYRFSFDMLGERAKTAADAARYFGRYMSAIEAIGGAVGPLAAADVDALMARPSVSVKLSAIHPRFDPGKEARLDAELLPRIVELAAAARRHGLGLTIDAEEQDRLDMTLGLFAATFRDPALDGWPGLGLAVQAYGKRAMPVLRWLERLAAQGAKRIPVRLVKGAYWDSEIKWAQERGLADYPVFTRKAHTDVSYLACMRFMLAHPSAFFPQFATHNAQSIASVYVAAGSGALRVPAPARHGRGALRGGGRRGQARRALPHLRAGRPARGPRRLSGAPSARERRQHLVRQPSGRRGGAARGHHSRSRRAAWRRSGAGRSSCSRVRPTSICPSAATAPGWRSASRRCGRRCWRRLRPSSMPRSLPLRRSSMARRSAAARRWSWC